MRALLAVAVLGIALLAPAGAARADDGAVTDRVIKDDRITESSGLALSLLHPGVLWTHNDSGNPPKIFAISQSGSTAATITVAGETNRDWEAIASLRYPASTGRSMIAIGDIGDNNSVHPTIRIAILPEPAHLVSQTITPQRVLRLRYPDGPRDAETLLSDPRNDRLYIVSKTLFGSSLYAVPASAWPQRASGTSSVITLQKLASSSASFITDGTFLPDGRMLLRGYGTLYLTTSPEDVTGGRLKILASVGLPNQDQGESLTTEDGGTVLLIGSEGKDEPVLRLTRADLGSVGRLLPGASSGSRASASPAAVASADAGSGVTGADHRPTVRIAGNTWLALAAGAAAVALLVIAALTLSRRR